MNKLTHHLLECIKKSFNEEVILRGCGLQKELYWQEYNIGTVSLTVYSSDVTTTEF